MTTVFRPRQGALDPRTLTMLGTRLRGELIRPGDASYESQRRVWNGSIDRYPASIARCADAADVVTALGFARTHGLLVAVRGGGHSFPGHSVCDDGMVIDLSLMKGIRVDPDARTAHVQAGVLLGELDQATQAYALALPAGIVTHTGVAGLTLGGGLGWIMRKYGLTVDNLLSVDMVTADGESVTASATVNPDLFWGSGVAAATSALSPSSNSGCTRWGPTSLRGRCFGRWRMRRRFCVSTATGSPTARMS
jgi:FAD/FMN-containing dehydrogenase